MNEKVKAAFDIAGIEIPFPHISLYSGDKSQPIEVAVINRAEE
jgi:small-conductance mechanosensitive channel